MNLYTTDPTKATRVDTTELRSLRLTPTSKRVRWRWFVRWVGYILEYHTFKCHDTALSNNNNNNNKYNVNIDDIHNEFGLEKIST